MATIRDRMGHAASRPLATAFREGWSRFRRELTITETILPGGVVTKYYRLVDPFGRVNDPGKMHYTGWIAPANKIPELDESNNFAEFDA